MNNDLRKAAKNDFEKDIFKLINNSVFGKTMENVKKHIDIKLVTTEARRNYLPFESSYYTAKFISENLLAIEVRKTQTSMNKLIYVGCQY